jgi:hypothetical protein
MVEKGGHYSRNAGSAKDGYLPKIAVPSGTLLVLLSTLQSLIAGLKK